jgi:hypothetical protein
VNESERRILVSVQLFEPTPDMLAALRERRKSRGEDDVTATYDAFMLEPGLGPPTYLSSDGRIIWDDDIWGVVGTRGEALAAIQAGVKKTGVVELGHLLPLRPFAAADCSECSATGWFDAHGQLRDAGGMAFSVVCMKCAGLGWTAASLVLTDSVLDISDLAVQRR